MNETSDARQTVTLKGVITLMSPLFQVETSEKVVGEDGKQKLILRHRRDKFIVTGKNGELYPISILGISSNTLRGTFRDLIAACITDSLKAKADLPSILDYKSLIALFMGGGGVEKSTGITATEALNKIEAMKARNVVVSLFGASGERIVAGKTVFGVPILLCTETVDSGLIPEEIYSQYKSFISYNDVMREQQLVRHDDLSDINIMSMLSEKGIKEYLAAEAKTAAKKAGQDIKDSTRQTVFNAETVAPGAKYYHYMIVKNATSRELGAILAAFNKIAEYPYIGGMSARGFGEIALEYSFIEGDSTIGDVSVNRNGSRKFDYNDLDGTVISDALESFNSYVSEITPEDVQFE